MFGKKAIQKQLAKTLYEAIPLISTKEQAVEMMVQIARCEKANLFNRVETEQMKAAIQEKINELELCSE